MNLLCMKITVRSVYVPLMHHIYGLPGTVHTKACVKDIFVKRISKSHLTCCVLFGCMTRYGLYFPLMCKPFNDALFKCKLPQRY